MLGVNALTARRRSRALRIGDAEIDARRATVSPSARACSSAATAPVDAAPSQANFVWLPPAACRGSELAARLRRGGVIVVTGGPLGDDEHVRATVRAATTDRLLEAARTAF